MTHVPNLPDAITDAAARREVIVGDAGMGGRLAQSGFADRLVLGWAAPLLEDDGVPAMQAIHERDVRAGARIITANTFPVSPPRAKAYLRNTGRPVPTDIGPVLEGMTQQACLAARGAIASVNPDHKVWVVGSMAPMHDNDNIARANATDKPTLERTHNMLAERLADNGVDGALIETVGTLREVEVMRGAAARAGLRSIVSLYPDRTGTMLFDGQTTIGEATDRLLDHPNPPVAIGANCAAPRVITRALEDVRQRGIPMIAYGQGREDAPGDAASAESGETKWEWKRGATPAEYQTEAAGWANRLGVTVIAGCCGTTEHTITGLAALARSRNK
jgi:methionine synthase I (cobalamin-dependent)